MEGATRQAHSIKGAAANTGAESIRRVASDMEMAGRDGDKEAAASLMPGLELASRQFKRLAQPVVDVGDGGFKNPN